MRSPSLAEELFDSPMSERTFEATRLSLKDSRVLIPVGITTYVYVMAVFLHFERIVQLPLSVIHAVVVSTITYIVWVHLRGWFGLLELNSNRLRVPLRHWFRNTSIALIPTDVVHIALSGSGRRKNIAVSLKNGFPLRIYSRDLADGDIEAYHLAICDEVARHPQREVLSQRFATAQAAYDRQKGWPFAASFLIALMITGHVLGGKVLPTTLEPAVALASAGGLFPALAWKGEWLRLFTASFLHLSIWHLAVNVTTLALLSYRFEKQIGSLSFAAIFFAGALLGNVAESFVSTAMLVCGASGGVYAIAGAYVHYVIVHGNTLPASIKIGPSWWMIGVGILSLTPLPGTAFAAHLVGAVTGVILGFLLQARAHHFRYLTMFIVATYVLCVAAAVRQVPIWRESRIHSARSLLLERETTAAAKYLSALVLLDAPPVDQSLASLQRHLYDHLLPLPRRFASEALLLSKLAFANSDFKRAVEFAGEAISLTSSDRAARFAVAAEIRALSSSCVPHVSSTVNYEAERSNYVVVEDGVPRLNGNVAQQLVEIHAVQRNSAETIFMTFTQTDRKVTRRAQAKIEQNAGIAWEVLAVFPVKQLQRPRVLLLDNVLPTLTRCDPGLARHG
jgi:membrane associated rhomboid family serine protease